MKTITIADIGPVTLKKSARAKRLILRIDHRGQAVVTLPKYVPYIVAEKYARSHIDWIKSHTSQQTVKLIEHGSTIGSRQLLFRSTDSERIKTRVKTDAVIVELPYGTDFDTKEAQEAAQKAVERAVKKQAETELLPLLNEIAEEYNLHFTTSKVKNMRSRWGSCSSDGVIVLNMWLVQLPLELQEYVMCHELTHLKHQHHQAAFWSELSTMLPNYKALRKELKSQQPRLQLA